MDARAEPLVALVGRGALGWCVGSVAPAAGADSAHNCSPCRRSVMYEEVYPNDYTSARETRAGLARYLAFYNHERSHQALNYQTPAEIYFPSRSP